MNKSGLKTSFVVSIIVMIFLGIYLIYYFINKDEIDNTKNSYTDIVEKNNDVDILLMQRYIDAFNKNCIDMKSFYAGKTLIKDIDSNVKLTTILNLNNNYDKKYIENEYYKLFNESITLDKVTGTCPKLEYNNKVNKIDCTCNVKSGVVIRFIKSSRSDNSIKLYYKVAFYSSKKYLGQETRILSKDAKGKEIIDSRVLSNDVEEIDYQNYLNEHYDDFYTFKFTFKLNENNNYYFYSINRSQDKI